MGRKAWFGLLVAFAVAGTLGAPAGAAAVSPGPWSGLSAGLNQNAVTAVAVSGSTIYAGGEFVDANGNTGADYIARWNGSTWQPLPHNDGQGGPALDNYVKALAVAPNGDLYVGGNFSNASGIAAANGLARWNETIGWSAVGNFGIPGGVSAIAISGDSLFVGGNFDNAAGNAAADDVAKYSITGNAWTSLGSTAPLTSSTSAVNAIAVYGQNIVIGGDFLNAGGDPNADYLAMWNSVSGLWSSVGTNSAGGPPILTSFGYVYALAVSGSNLYIGGKFGNAGGVGTADCVAKWNGSAWSGLGSHPNFPTDGSLSCANTPVYALAVYGGSVFAGGAFINTNYEDTADKIVEWDGSAWHALGSNPAGTDGAINYTQHVYALAVQGTNLVAGGSFTDVAGIASADRVARWGLGTPPAPRKPDGRIRIGTGTFAGNNVYNLTGTNQTKTKAAARGATITFGISIQSDATSGSDSFRVQAANVNAGTGYTVTYFQGTTNITSAVVAGTWTSNVLAPGATQLITAKMKVLNTAAVGSNVTRIVTITSVGDSTKKDAVKFVGKRS